MQHQQQTHQMGGMQSTGAQATGGQPPGIQQTTMARPQLRSVSVDDIVQTDIVSVQTDDDVRSIVDKMESEQVGTVVVVDGEQPIGIITDRDIALALAEEDVTDRTAETFIQEDLVTGSTEMSVFDALETMKTENVRRLPIVDDNGTIEGIVALDDILVLLGTKVKEATDIIQAQSPRL